MEILPIVGFSIWLVVKIFVVVALGIYLIFALVVVRQVRLMIDTVKIGFEMALTVMAYSHLILAVLILILAIAIL
jgi:hypothetical protein